MRKLQIGPLLEDFSEDSGVAIDVRYGDSANLALLIDEEGDRTPADVFISQSPGAVGFLDAAGGVVDTFDYADRAPFPELADGHGHSLERRSPRHPAGDPANWGASTGVSSPEGERRTWRRVVKRGVATSNRLYFYLADAGTACIDDLSLRLPSGGPNARLRTGPWNSGRVGTSRPVAASQNRTARSTPPEARRRPSGLNATHSTLSVCPRRAKTSFPVPESQTFTVRSP